MRDLSEQIERMNAIVRVTSAFAIGFMIILAASYMGWL